MKHPLLNKTSDVVTECWGPNNTELQTIVWPKNLKDWTASVDSAVTDLAGNDTDLQHQVIALRAEVDGLSSWVHGARTFTDFMAARYPEIIREFNMIEETKGRVAGTDTVKLLVK